MCRFISKWWQNVQRSAEIKTEFIKWCGEISQVGKARGLSNSQKRSYFNGTVNKLSNECYNRYFNRIMHYVQRLKGQCQPYKDSYMQLCDILAWIPRFKDHREQVLGIIQERRKKYGLVI